MKEKTCCFFGHKKVRNVSALKQRIYDTAEALIINNKATVFLLGNECEFDFLCHGIITELKQKYPYIKRIYVRAEFPYINNAYKNYLLQYYEDTYYPEKLINAHKSANIGRNYEMIDKSDFCIVYCDEDYASPIKLLTNMQGKKKNVL